MLQQPKSISMLANLKPAPARLNTPSMPENWQALQIYAFYRFIMSVALLVAIYFNFFPNFIANINEPLFIGVAKAYLSFSTICAIVVLLKRPGFHYQTLISLWFDVLFLVLLMHAGGGVLTGLGILLIVVVAAHSILIPGILSLLIAALASTSLLTEQVYSQFTQSSPQLGYPQAGLLGLTIFITAIGIQILSAKALKNQHLASTRGERLAIIGRLAAYVVSNMQLGVVVYNQANTIEMINQAGLNFLGLKKAPKFIHGLPAAFQEAILQWQSDNAQHSRFPIKIHPSGPPIKLSFHELDAKKSDVLIFLDDISQEAKQAQDIKLASIGKLTANIAHELRNPLAAASHAAQLMNESNHVNEDDQCLLSIIQENCNRMNTVIRNVLSLSSHKKAAPESLNLITWLQQFIQSFHASAIKAPKITLVAEADDLYIAIDPSQLRQILVNLFENGLRYSYEKNQAATLSVNVYLSPAQSEIYLDIQDQGVGIAPEHIKHVFEPFYTTESQGSGLGLYIAKELSEMNNAALCLVPSETGCLFRLIFSLEQGVNGCVAPTL